MPHVHLCSINFTHRLSSHKALGGSYWCPRVYFINQYSKGVQRDHQMQVLVSNKVRIQTQPCFKNTLVMVCFVFKNVDEQTI